jgi:hypothetical protein
LNKLLSVLVRHRLILRLLFGSLFHQCLANLVGVNDRFFYREAILAPIAMLYRSFRAADIAISFDDRLCNHLNDSLWRLLLSSVDLSEVFGPGQVPLGPSRYFLGVPK